MEGAAFQALAVPLASYFAARDDIAMAFLFGSAVSGRMTEESDVDIAAYFATAAEEFRDLISDFAEITARSRSLNETDRSRLLHILDFLRTEIKDASILKRGATLERFEADHAYRRNLERWVENLANATIDVAKIVLAASGRMIPRTYRAVVLDLKDVEGRRSIDIDLLASCARLRKLLAHEYLDLRYERISKLLAWEPALHLQFVELVEDWMEAHAEGSNDRS